MRALTYDSMPAFESHAGMAASPREMEPEPETDVVAVRVLPAMADPAEPPGVSAPPLYLDRRFLGAEPGDRLFAYEMTAQTVARIGTVAAPGDHVVFSNRVTRLAASRVYAVRHRGRVIPARLALLGERLVMLPATGDENVEVVETSDWRDAVCGVAVVVIRRLLPRQSSRPERRPPMMALADADLVAETLKRGTDAMAEFQRRYRPLIAGVIGRMPLADGDRAALEERVWGKLLDGGMTNLERWKGTGSFVPYLARVIRWVLNDRARGPLGDAAHDLALEDRLDALPEGALGPLEILRERETMKAIERAVGALAARDQELLYRRYVFDEPNEEIAAALGVGLSTVHVALHRARTRLMARLGGIKGTADVRRLIDRMSRATATAD
jgi:RNA polymerase sigma-70 factor (ECF subfamily)